MADWERCSKLGCILADCVGIFDIRASLSDDAGRLVFCFCFGVDSEVVF